MEHRLPIPVTQPVGTDAVAATEIAELRLRTALELHDGVLQTMTGASLQIATARRLVRVDPGAAETILDMLGRVVEAEQRELRLYVDEVKGGAPAWTDTTILLPERIAALLDRLGVMWDVNTSVRTELGARIGAESSRQILRIIQEACVNAARHGGAKTVQVAVAQDGPDLTITISDDGRGFPFLGDYDDAALKAKRLGPLSLKHRVALARGTIAISSVPGGSRVSVRLPISHEDG